jgi:hypothetical protein
MRQVEAIARLLLNRLPIAEESLLDDSFTCLEFQK